MYALFVLSVHVYYVNCNAKTQMGYLCALIKYKLKLINLMQYTVKLLTRGKSLSNHHVKMNIYRVYLLQMVIEFAYISG